MIKGESGDIFFGHGKSFLNSPLQPRVGRQVLFTPLPPAMGKMPRATEIEILPSRPSPKTIVVKHLPGRSQLVLRDSSGDKLLGELAY
jgi:hypothetical protein